MTECNKAKRACPAGHAHPIKHLMIKYKSANSILKIYFDTHPAIQLFDVASLVEVLM